MTAKDKLIETSCTLYDLRERRAVRFYQRSDEYVDSRGHLHVPLKSWAANAPKRNGWKPFFVSVNLGDPTPKVVIYKRDVPAAA